MSNPVIPGVPLAIVRPLVFRAENIAVSDVGENVEIRIGNSEPLIFPYAEALRFSQIVRVHAKRAKRRTGDPRHWSVLGTLDGLVK